MKDSVDTTNIRNVYREGFDWEMMEPLCIPEGKMRVIVKAVLPSDFNQLVGTDHLNEAAHCKLWQVVKASDGPVGESRQIEKGDFVTIVKAAIDGVDVDAPRYGIVDAFDLACRVQAKKG